MNKYTVTMNVGGKSPYVFELDPDGADILRDLIYDGKCKLKDNLLNIIMQFLNVSLASLELSASSDNVPNYMSLDTNGSLYTVQMICEVLTHSKISA